MACSKEWWKCHSSRPVQTGLASNWFRLLANLLLFKVLRLIALRGDVKHYADFYASRTLQKKRDRCTVSGRRSNGRSMDREATHPCSPFIATPLEINDIAQCDEAVRKFAIEDVTHL